MPKALITGGARRIGRAMALHLAQKGWDVAITYNQSKADASKLSGILGIQCDLRHPSQMTGLIEKVVDKLGGLDLLINSASVFEASGMLDGDNQAFQNNLDIHVSSPLELIRAFAKRRQGGHVVNILDTKVEKDSSKHFDYLLSKKTLGSLTQMAAMALAPDFRVNAIAPGAVLPPITAEDGYFERLSKNIPLKKTGSPDDICRALDYLCEADFVTGQILYVDGGEHLRG